MKNTLITLASVAALAGTVNAQVANGNVYNQVDNAMNSSDFIQTSENLAYGTTSVTGTLSNSSTGGNGGSYLKTQLDMVTPATSTHPTATIFSAGIFYKRNGWTFSPASFALGAGQAFLVNMNIDALDDPDNQITGLYTLQDGVTRVRNVNYQGQATWSTIGGENTTPFANGGGNVEFGFYTASQTNQTSSTVTTTSGYDNLTVSVDVVPEPSSTALLGLGGLALLLRRKK